MTTAQHRREWSAYFENFHVRAAATLIICVRDRADAILPELIMSIAYSKYCSRGNTIWFGIITNQGIAPFSSDLSSLVMAACADSQIAAVWKFSIFDV